MKAYHVILAAVGGALVGAAAALLTAPQSGDKTRVTVRDFLRSHCPGMKEHRINNLAEKIAEEIREAE